jgi:hypothetical protein
MINYLGFKLRWTFEVLLAIPACHSDASQQPNGDAELWMVGEDHKLRRTFVMNCPTDLELVHDIFSVETAIWV